MEEETARIAQGQVPEMDSFVMTQKDGLPPSITAIFSPPENFNSSPSPSAEVSKDANGPQPLEEPPMPLPVEDNEADQPQDYDSDEGVGEDIAVEKGKISPEAEAHPTDEEVDAALAEIDSIPDGGCEAGEVDDDDDDEDEWSYYKMEPQKHSQTSNEDLIVTGTSEITVDTLPVTGGDLQHSPQTPESASFVKEASPCGSPQAPSSPRTVEGFVTSVELNTPEESYNTNLAINQSTEYFNGGQIEQSSGPFSVYVSSSPEPVSIESPPVNLLSPLIPSNAVEMQEEPKSDLGKEEIEELEGPSVEIVHAQSTVEVITDTPVEVEIPKDETVSPIPDVMTQSITGGLPSDPCVLSTVDEDKVPSPLFEDAPHFTEEAKQHTEVVIEESFTEQQFAAEVEIEAISPDIGKITDTINVEEIVEDVKQETEATIEEMLIAVENIEQIPPNIPEPVDDAVESESGKMASNQLEDRFTEEINKAFEVPLDQMIISFHEDRTQPTDLISSLEISVAPEEEAVELSQKVSSPVTSILETGVEELTEVTNLLETRVKALPEEVSQMQISEEVQKPTSPITIPIPISHIQTLEEEREPVSPVTTPVAATKPEMKRPSSAPRTTGSKPAPPKPSPRSVGSKLSTSRLSSTSSPTAAPTGPSPGVKGIPKRPTSLAAATASKPLRKLDSAKPSTTTSTAKTRASTTTSRASSSATRTTTTTTTTKPTAAAKTKATPKSTVPPAKTRANPPTAALKTTTAAAKSKVTTAAATTATTATRRLTSMPKPTSSTTTTRVSSTSKVPNGIASASKTMTKTTTTTTRKPLTTKTPTTTSSSVPSTRKPLPAATKTATTTSTLKQRTVASAPAATKDTKNSTNRMLSTTKTSTTKSSSQPASRTSTTTKPRSFPLKTPKTQGLKGKKDGVKSPVANPKIGESPMANGENKIVEEESTIEVKEKIMQEETTEVRESVIEETICSMSEKVIEEVSSIEDVTMKAEKMLVNGDH